MNLSKRLALLLAAAAGIVAITTNIAHAAPLLSEGFDDISTLPASGWVLINNSAPPGTTGWFQGNANLFPAADGPADSYIAANFSNAAPGGAISNWLLTPVLDLYNGESLAFSLRLFGEGFLDRVEVYLSTSGSSADVGSTVGSTGDFSLLTAFESTTDTGWDGQSVLVGGLAAPATGRFAFRYVVDDTNVNGDYIGLDSVSVNAIPAPGSIALVVIGAGVMLYARRRRPLRWLAMGGLSLAGLVAQAGEPQAGNGVMTFPNVTVSVPAGRQAAPSMPAGGATAFKNPSTGKLSSPTSEQMAELDARRKTASPSIARSLPVKPQVFSPPHGGKAVMLDSSHRADATALGDQK